MKAIIITVGTGSRPDIDITKPLVKTIKNSHPDFTAFIVSEGSRQYACKIANELSFDNSKHEIFELSTAEDLQQIFKEINNAFRALYKRGFKSDEIEADYTSGTKAMTGGLVLSAIFNSCASLKYITGDRKNGIVQDGTERFLAVPPEGIFSRRELQFGLRLMDEMRFVSALEIFKNINNSLLDNYDKDLIYNVMPLAQAFISWDRFDHFRFFSEYDKIKFDYNEIEKFRINKSAQENILKIGKTIKSGCITQDVIIDIYNNAARRFIEGKFDDTLARLYRVAEMLAQLVLKKEFQIETGDVKIDKIPKDKRGNIESYSDDRSGKIKIGLKRSFVLLN